MLANLDEIEQAYRTRPDTVPPDPDLETWLADSRQAIADQRDWLIQVEQDHMARQVAMRKAQFGIAVLILALLGVVLFS